MENLNAKQIKKALECCANAYDCFTCDNYKRHCIGGFRTAIAQNALSLIKELTEENERLRGDIAKEFTCVFGQPHKVTDCPIDDEIANAKADTAREIFKEFDRLMENNEVYFHQTDEMREEFSKIKKKYTEEGK